MLSEFAFDTKQMATNVTTSNSIIDESAISRCNPSHFLFLYSLVTEKKDIRYNERVAHSAADRENEPAL